MGRWLTGEPRLRDVLADPVIRLMMRRDRVDPEQLHAFLRHLGDARRERDRWEMPRGWADIDSPKRDALAH